MVNFLFSLSDFFFCPVPQTDEYMRQELSGSGVNLERNTTHLDSEAFVGFRSRPALSEVISRREEAATKNGHLVKKGQTYLMVQDLFSLYSHDIS